MNHGHFTPSQAAAVLALALAATLLLTLRAFLGVAPAWWCRLAHGGDYWPSHSTVRCRHCLRERRVNW
jgi:hypothetical protein